MSHEMSCVTSHITCHKRHKKLQNSLGPHVWPEFLVCHIFLETWGKLHYIGNDSRYHYSLLPSRLSDLGSSRTSSIYKSVHCIIIICIFINLPHNFFQWNQLSLFLVVFYPNLSCSQPAGSRFHTQYVMGGRG